MPLHLVYFPIEVIKPCIYLLCSELHYCDHVLFNVQSIFHVYTFRTFTFKTDSFLSHLSDWTLPTIGFHGLWCFFVLFFPFFKMPLILFLAFLHSLFRIAPSPKCSFAASWTTIIADSDGRAGQESGLQPNVFVTFIIRIEWSSKIWGTYMVRGCAREDRGSSTRNAQ